MKNINNKNKNPQKKQNSTQLNTFCQRNKKTKIFKILFQQYLTNSKITLIIKLSMHNQIKTQQYD